MFIQKILPIRTQKRSIYTITEQVSSIVKLGNIQTGLCHLFCQHTSCSLILCENYDPTVKLDIETYLADLVTDGDKRFRHTSEGEDDMSSHLRTLLTQSELTVPISEGELSLGCWQGLNLYEHRYHGYLRSIVVTLMGNKIL